MFRKTGLMLGATFSLVLGAGCASTPENTAERSELVGESRDALRKMTEKDPSLESVLAESEGYVVFPSVGKGGFIVGASMADGVVFEDGQIVGFASLGGASIGPQVGAQSFTELIVFKTEDALTRLKSGNFDLTASVSATALASGAAAQAKFEGGTAVFIDDEVGLMAEASVGGQQINFSPTR